MKLFAISDLHFSGTPPTKPMDVFGEHWHRHRERIIEAWQRLVTPEDFVLISGDISWGMRIEESLEDLYAIAELPGQAILLRGNHDYWWSGVQKMKRLTQDKLLFLYNNYVPVGNTAICGTRGWIAPGDSKFTDDDLTVFEREVSRMERSLQQAKRDGFERIIATSHYPPFNEKKEATALLETAQKYGAQRYIYGHLHDEASFAQVPKEWQGIPLTLASADYLGFVPIEIPLNQ